MAAPGEMFGVTVKCLIGPAGAPGVMIDINPVLDILGTGIGEGPLVEWSVVKQLGRTPDHATVSIYNLDFPSRALIRGFLEQPLPVVVQLFVGWNGIPELLFRGDIVTIEPERRDPTDIVTTIQASDSLTALADTPPIGGSFMAFAVETLIVMLVQQLGLVSTPAATATIAARANDPQYKLPAANFQVALNGDPASLMDDIMASLDLNWKAESGFLVVYEHNIRPELAALPPILLGPSSGLESFTRINSSTFEFTALGQSRCVPGAPVQFMNELMAPVGPTLFVETVSFAGSSETTSTMTGVAKTRSPLEGAVPFDTTTGVLESGGAL